MQALSTLPARENAASKDEVRAQYLTALEGVTQYSLTVAVKRALQGKHGSNFFPSPPEMRTLCEEAMTYVQMHQNRVAQERRQREENAAIDAAQSRQTPEERARMGFKLSVLSASLAIPGGPDRVAEANSRSLAAMIELGEQLGVHVPDNVRQQAIQGAPPPRPAFVPKAISRALLEFGDREILDENVSHQQFAENCRARKYPVGAEYSAVLGVVFEAQN